MHGILRQPDADALFDGIASRLTQAAHNSYEVPDGNWPSDGWQIYLLDSPEPNALNLGDGVLVLSRGLITELNSESELAAVISHEMAHQLLGHIDEAWGKMAQESDLQAQGAFQLDQDQELAADRIGFVMLANGRYEPEAAVKALNVIYRQRTRTNNLTAEDPSIRHRIGALVSQIQRRGPVDVRTINTRLFQEVRSELLGYANRE